MDLFKKKKWKSEKNTWEAELEDLFNGYGEIGGESTPYTKSLTFLEGKSYETIRKILDACLIIYSKPISWLMTGKAKNPEGKKKKARAKKDSNVEEVVRTKQTIKVGLAKYLPMMTELEVGNMEIEALEDMVQSRSEWKEEFKLLNVTKCKRLALIGLELCESVSKLQAQWLNIHKSVPSGITNFNRGDSDTNEIFRKDIEEFVRYRDDWNRPEVKDIIRGKGDYAEKRAEVEFVPANLGEIMDRMEESGGNPFSSEKSSETGDEE
jgi:hypothetical protein